MLKNFLLLTVRNLLANRLFTLINIVGLAVGLACVILISLFVRHETSYDSHWANADRTYKVMRTFTPNNGSPDLFLATNAPQAGPLLQQDFPEFEHVARIMNGGELIISHPETNQSFLEAGLHFADPNIYQVFDIPLIEGDWETALQAPFQMVISETVARKYFGNDSALGQTLTVENQIPAQITGVMQDLDENTHLAANGFVSISTLVAMFGEEFMTNWGSNNFHTYVVAPENYDINTFIDAIPDFLNRHIAENATEFTNFEVLSVTDIHLHSQRDNELEANGNIVTVTTFSAIAVVILLIACFNFMNLSTARSASRAREVGLRKTLGADRSQIIIQFLGESILLSLIAVVIAAALVSIVLGWFNNLIGIQLQFNPLQEPAGLALLILFGVAVGILAGSYPAFYLSSFSASKILKGELTRGAGGANFRKILVVAQFAISIALVVASGIALTQLRYAMTMDPGFTKDQIVIVRGNGLEGLSSNYQTMKQELLRNPEIVSVTAANLMPGDQNTNSDGIRYEGANDEFLALPYLNVDYDFFETFDIELIAGRSFDEQRGTDLFVEPSDDNPATTASYIVNEIAARQMGFSPEQVLNKWFEVRRGRDTGFAVRGPIIGVAENIYFSSIREAVKPVYYRVMEHDNPRGQFPNFAQMALRLRGNNLEETLGFIENTFAQFSPGTPFQQEFMDRRFEELYRAEQRQGEIFTLFSIIAIFIAALGLFGLASYMTEQRTREIGIRKVLGSSVFNIIVLLTKDFTRMVLLANVIAWPIAWYFMSSWLENFAYQASIGIGIYLLAGILAWLIATFTVGSLAAITANINPTQSLRHE